MQYPLYIYGEDAGTLDISQEGLYLNFSARCKDPKDGIYRAFAVFEGKRLPLGVLAPNGNLITVSKTYPLREIDDDWMQQPVYGEAELSKAFNKDSWKSLERPETVFFEDELKDAAARLTGMLIKENGRGFYVAAPYSEEKEFPLPMLFCLAEIQMIRGRWYAVFQMDISGMPMI